LCLFTNKSIALNNMLRDINYLEINFELILILNVNLILINNNVVRN
jgi:hypothetical protein